jgi:secreted trypsin-like serine protease
VLSPNWVLTAAHCITESPNIGRLEVLAGKWNLAAVEPTQQFRGIAQSIIHPGYVGGVAPDDVALFRLAAPLAYNAWIGPIAMPSELTDTVLKPDMCI